MQKNGWSTTTCQPWLDTSTPSIRYQENIIMTKAKAKGCYMMLNAGIVETRRNNP